MTLFFTSDTHFRHAAILHHDRRPFVSVEEMEAEIIRRWNARVRPRDTVYHLGDFAWGKAKVVAEILPRLNGHIHLIWGNHDHNTVRRMTEWASSQPYLEIKDGDDLVCLHHYAQRTWNRARYGSYHLFGHSHGNLPPQGRSIDVGTCCWDYKPVTLAEIKARLDGLGLLELAGNEKAEAVNG
ncbi:hypothetical protein BB934_45455 (plasmid) [Microvirga ossetica]|uniref:Calcineurin-like phosphoesterase domain-containing protein n=1 Tax=Microvirga ossetica TaxID=1882682 RepID=A0A1B2EZP7_9HYPH|nr:metallophosphoesterase family protein [Microvirga ossetica]ANY85469.1 hypothetical protein BB934_45455 [Microvirga ossetica]